MARSTGEKMPEYIRRLRDERSWTQEAAGEKLGWGQAKVSRIENAVALPTFNDLATIARVFGRPHPEVIAVRSRSVMVVRPTRVARSMGAG